MTLHRLRRKLLMALLAGAVFAAGLGAVAPVHAQD